MPASNFEGRDYARATKVTAMTMAALLVLPIVLSLAECASMSPQERAADTGQPVGILLYVVTALVGITYTCFVFPFVADRLQSREKFGVVRFVGQVVVSLAVFALAISAVLHMIFGGSLSAYSLAELGRLFILLLGGFAVLVSPFALLWYWLAQRRVAASSS